MNAATQPRIRDVIIALVHPVLATISVHVLRPLTRNRVYRVRHGLASGLLVKGGLDFLPRPVSPEERFLTRCDFCGRTVLDIGAHCGLFTLFFSRAVGPDGRVFSFEPHPGNADKLRTNVALNAFANVTVMQTAVADRCGQAVLTTPANETSVGEISKCDSPRGEQSPLLECHEVSLTTIDHLIKIGTLPAPHFVKIDVEGAELAVLQGMKATLVSAKPELLIEVHSKDSYDPIPAAKALLELLTSAGYEMQLIETGEMNSALTPNAVLKGHLFARAPDRS